VLSWFPVRSSGLNAPARPEPSSGDGDSQRAPKRVRARLSTLVLRPSSAFSRARSNVHEAGQELVEFALILPLLLLLFLGIIEFGRAMLAYNTIANAAREGARYGIVTPNSGAVQARCLEFTSAAGLTGVTCSPTIGAPGGAVQVRVDYDFKPVAAGFLGIPDTITLHTQATMQREQ
jgi:Flp pilus assembly protein TadG